MTFLHRVLTLGTSALAAVAIASPALAHQDPNNPTSSDNHNHMVAICGDEGTENEGQVTLWNPSKQPPDGYHECEPGENGTNNTYEPREPADVEAEEEQRRRAAAEREAENRRLQQVIAREQAEADELEEQATLCEKRPSHATCSRPSGSVSQAKPASPKPVAYVAAQQQQKVVRHGNPAGVGVRPVAERPEDNGLEDAVDVPESDELAFVDPAARPGPRNLVWFSVVAMAAITSLGYGLWRVLFLDDADGKLL